MTLWLLKMFGIALIVTLIAELAIALFLGMRSRNILLLILLVNILTNPLAVLLHWLCNLYLPNLADQKLQLGIELLVILTEALIYASFSEKKDWKIPHPILFSIIANICSWSIGFFMF